MHQLILAHELETMALTANAAMLVREGRTDRALFLLDQRLGSSLMYSDRALSQNVRVPGNAPNLRKASERAEKYATTYHLDALAARARAVSAKMK